MSVQALSWVLERSEAALGPRLVLLSIANHADDRGDNAWPSVTTIARESRLSVRSVQYALRTLVELGELEVEEGAGRRGTHRYRLLKLTQRNLWDAPEGATDPRRICTPANTAGVQSKTSGGADSAPGGCNLRRETPADSAPKPSYNRPLTVQDPSDNTDTDGNVIKSSSGDRFPEFWRLFPRRVGKAAAKRVWLRKALNAKADEIVDHLRGRVRSDAQWQRDEGRFVPNPATWLSREGWEDEYQTGSPLVMAKATRFERLFGEDQGDPDHA